LLYRVHPYQENDTTKKMSLLLYGTSGHAKVVMDAAIATGLKITAAFNDFVTDETFKNIPVLGSYDPHKFPEVPLVIAIGDNGVRKKLFLKIRHDYKSVICPSAMIAPDVQIGKGVMILQRSILQASVRISNHVIINTATQVDHDCIIGDFAHIAPGVILCGNVEVGEGALVGAGAVVVPKIKIGKWSTVGAGSVVIRDVPDYAVACGNPSRIIKYNTP
jgi:sugar O-acyltransferase (sialic acid O-acetyltransferase NeuD family)